MDNPVLAYFDHNILSDLTDLPDEVIDHFFGALSTKKIVPVYSDENLHEITKSVKRVDQLLAILTDHGFHHIYEELVDFKPTDQIKLADKSPRERYVELQDLEDEFPSGTGDLDFVRKMYGGEIDASYFEIAISGLENAEAELRAVKNNGAGLLAADQLVEIEKSFTKLSEARDILNIQKAELERIDAADKSTVREIRKHGNVDSGELNSIRGERVLERIWDSIGPHFGAPDRKLADFFDQDINQFSSGYRFSRSIPTRVSGIYQQLNMIGYWKDEDMHKDGRFNAAQSDGRHVGMAAMCQIFFCNDERCRIKAHAAFEYVGSTCTILTAELQKDAI